MKKDDWSHLDSPVQRRTGKGIGVLRVEDHLHDIVGVTLKHLRASPTLHKPMIMKVLMLYFSGYKCKRYLLSEHFICSFADIMYCVLELLWDQMLIHSLTG